MTINEFELNLIEDLISSSLFTSLANSSERFANQIHDVVTSLFHNHAPPQTCSKMPKSWHLFPETISAKYMRRA